MKIFNEEIYNKLLPNGSRLLEMAVDEESSRVVKNYEH